MILLSEAEILAKSQDVNDLLEAAQLVDIARLSLDEIVTFNVASLTRRCDILEEKLNLL